jgi:tungstate transport system substrate-binding protein
VQRLKRKIFLISFCWIFIVFFSNIALGSQYQQIVIATGSPFELGLVDEMAQVFFKETGCTIRCIKTPTGPGLELGQHGLTHITMGHHPGATAKFVREGYAAKTTYLMYNLTIIVGPKEDPAKVGGLKDLKEAHKRIDQAKAKYLSRGDGGGMNILEVQIWKDLGVNPASNPGYEVSNKFMLDSLLDANRNLQYHMLDSSTWVLHKAKVKNLKVLVQGPKNEYEMCLVSAEKHPHLKYNYAFAEKFYEFLISEKGQKLIADFGVKQFG